MDAYSRTRLLLGSDGMDKLKNAHIAVFGLGGVGGYVVEALARCGVGTLELVDHDTVSLSNINRQILATRETVGMEKSEAARLRVQAIDPEIKVIARHQFFGPDTKAEFDFSRYTYVVDAIDTVTGKLALVQAAKEANVPILCCLGTGNKLDPTAFRIGDIYETSVCPLARIMRKECRKRGIEKLKVLYSLEEPIKPDIAPDDPILSELPEGRNALPGSVSFVPAAAGLMIAGQVIRDITGK
ncbi:MAG: tRNA threonylcarbamoyladenosine dehydratase [Oscillospiraceae bacterium]|nr:tRNA threonylcarbamoyladenosine dehydratase [Oscillospiraceae bacterium]